MVITKEWLQQCRTEKGAFTGSQIKILVEAGLIPRPEKSFPPTGWAKEIIGKSLPDDLAERFRENRNLYRTKHGYRVKVSPKEQGEGNLSLF